MFVDMAYQGFATGDLEKDSAGLRLLAKDGHKLALCQSFSKNMGLYGTSLLFLIKHPPIIFDFIRRFPPMSSLTNFLFINFHLATPHFITLILFHPLIHAVTHILVQCSHLSPFSYPYAGERCGAMTFLTESESEAKAVESQVKIIIRPLYSNPPITGARIATEILTSPDLYSEWLSPCTIIM